MKVLVTGGIGYIGSHIIVELLKNDYDVYIIDNFENSDLKSLLNLELLTKINIPFKNLDILDKKGLEILFSEEKFDSVIHLAGLKSVPASINNPTSYYNTNVIGSINLIDLCVKYKVYKFIFSSSACVYGEKEVEVNETMTDLKPNNPYGKTKLIIEELLEQVCHSNKDFYCVSLRYFNPVGCHESGLIGDKATKDLNLFKVIEKVVTNKQDKLTIFGNNYDTNDGTPVRDFIHVSDIAEGHVLALNYLNKKMLDSNLSLKENYCVFNMGSEKGYSVLEVVNAYMKYNDIKFDYSFGDRREGDIVKLISNSEKIFKYLGWKAKRTLEDMCKTSYKFAINEDCYKKQYNNEFSN